MRLSSLPIFLTVNYQFSRNCIQGLILISHSNSIMMTYYKLLPIQELSLLCFGRRYFFLLFFPVKNKMTIKEIYAILISLTLSSDLLPFLLPLNQNSHYFITQIQILHRKLASLVDVTLFFKM